MTSTPKVKHYSLLDYTATIKTVVGTTLVATIGGAQSYLGRISVTQEAANITKNTDVSGSTVYSFSNNHSGTVAFELSFVAEAMDTLIGFIKERYVDEPSSWKDATFTIDITRAGSSSPAISCEGCMLTKRPDWETLAEVGVRSYEFVAAKITERSLAEQDLSSTPS